MTRALHTVREDEPVTRALEVFTRSGVGRLLVVDAGGRLVGVPTPGDITRGLLRALQDAFQIKEERRYRASQVFEDIVSDCTSVVLRYDVAVRDFNRAGRASSALKQALNRIGVEPGVVRRAAIISYEAEMNIVIHSAAGGRIIAEVTPQSISIVARDDGPGIPDIEQALQPGYSTAPDWIREMGFGAGMGLDNIRGSADEMHLESSPETGTRLEAVIYLKPGEETVRNACR
jgi:anti-sigma regulatory factor (Ser/Thr protein kinase)